MKHLTFISNHFKPKTTRRRCTALLLLWHAALLLQLAGSALSLPPTTVGRQLACSAQTELHRQFTEEHPLVYTDAWDLWPYVFLDDNGVPQGYNVDLLTMIFDQLDIPFVIDLKPTTQALEALHDHKADLMLGMVAHYHDDYTTLYGKHTLQLFTHSLAHPASQPPRVRTTNDLASQQVIVHEGSFSHHLMQDRGWEQNATAMGDMDKAVQLVSANNNGQILWNTMSLKWLINKYHADKLMLSPVDMPSGDYRFMANDSLLLDAIDRTFVKLKAEDKLIPIEQKWFYPEELKEHSSPSWLWNVVIAIVAVTLVLTGASLIFRLREQRATREGRRRTARLALILNTCQVKVWTYDIRKQLFNWYDSAKKQRRTYSISDFSRRYHPDDFVRLMDAVDSIAQQKATELELEMNAMDGADGEERTYIFVLSVLRHDREGRPALIICTKSDITDDHQRKQKTTDIIHRYQAVFDTAMVDMVYYDSNGCIINMNQRAQQTFQMPLDAVRKEGVKLSDILHEEYFKISDFQKTDIFYATLFLDYAKEKKLESRKREGNIKYELQLVPVFDDKRKFVGAYGTGREVTEVATTYRLAHQSLLQLKATLKNVAEHVNNINYALQVAGVRIITYSPQSHMFVINHRLHEAQYVLTQQRCISLTDEGSMNGVMRSFRAMDRRSNAIINCEVRTRLRLPGRKHLWLEVHMYPEFDGNGKLMHYKGICRDTTDLKHTERLLQLETEKAQEVEQVKNRFLHNMCQEIRTPLDTVVGNAEKFEQQHTPEDEATYIENIKSSTSYLLDLINDILFLSRLDAKMVEINRQPCDFAQTFESYCHMALSNRRKDGVNYVVENQFNHLVVNIDDMNTGRIIQELMANAIEHTSHGTVRAHYEYVGNKLLIAIEDTGEGISQERIAHLFDRFNDGSNSGHGTGLGLPICHELATQMGGNIDINSEVGKGTTVWVTIPCEASAIEHKTNS